MAKVTFNTDLCKGCGLCVSACPKKLLVIAEDQINSKGYSPDNCRWVNMKTQNNNRRSNTVIEYGGESHTITEWAEIKGLTVSALLHRLYCGRYTVEESLNLPRMRKRKPVVA